MASGPSHSPIWNSADAPSGREAWARSWLKTQGHLPIPPACRSGPRRTAEVSDANKALSKPEKAPGHGQGLPAFGTTSDEHPERSGSYPTYNSAGTLRRPARSAAKRCGNRDERGDGNSRLPPRLLYQCPAPIMTLTATISPRSRLRLSGLRRELLHQRHDRSP